MLLQDYTNVIPYDALVNEHGELANAHDALANEKASIIKKKAVDSSINISSNSNNINSNSNSNSNGNSNSNNSSNKIKPVFLAVFPAVPTVWKEAVFYHLRTLGAFLVSAKREQGK
jgi:hypothetical protein